MTVPQALAVETPYGRLLCALVADSSPRLTLMFPHPTVSADTEVVGGDGQQHDPHLGPASRLLLPASHLHQPYRLQVSALGWAQSLTPAHFSLPSYLATSFP